MTPLASKSPIAEASDWRRTMSAYRTPNTGRGVFELVVTLLPFCVLWYLVYWALSRGHPGLYILLIVPAAGLLVRLFLIQHDCGHYAFFPNRRANDWVGRLISVLTMTPYDHWRHAHAIHHATSGNLARRGVGDVDTLTIAEYLARPAWSRFRYRLYRHPAVMFGIGPAFLFVLQNRIPAGFMRSGWSPWVSTMATNLAIAVLAGLLISTIGWQAFLSVHAPILLLGAVAGVWLFYVQHQFECTFWSKGDGWNVHEAGLRGSSHYDLPLVLKWFTANIGVHHVHHLCSRIPFYRLSDVLHDHPKLRGMGRLTLWESIKCIRLVLWDEERQRLVSFQDLRERPSVS